MIISDLLTNMVAVSIIGLFPNSYSSNQIFRDFTFNKGFPETTNIARLWHLDLPQSLTTNAVTDFNARPCVEGANITIEFSNRFEFGWSRGQFSTFYDKDFRVQTMLTPWVETNKMVFDRWMRASNRLDLKSARTIAESGLQSIGINLKARGFQKPTKAEQDGEIPYYLFAWDGKHDHYSVDVSGITGNIVQFYYMSTVELKPIKPGNELLGLPTNPIFVWRRPAPSGASPVYELYTNYSRLELEKE